MLRKSLILLIGFLFLCVSCQTSVQSPKVCNLDVTIDFPQYQNVQLVNEQDSVLDSAVVVDGKVRFAYSDTLSMPFVGRIILNNASDSLDFMVMPVVIECGNVSVSISDYIVTSGTPNNIILQQYLNELQEWTNHYKEQPDVTLAQFREAMKVFIAAQVKKNQDNVVGRYIQESFNELNSDSVR